MPHALKTRQRESTAVRVIAPDSAELDPSLLEPIKPLESFIDRYIGDTDLPGILREAVRYALLGGGKRLRPVLAWHACVAAGGAGSASLPAGAAVELVHAFSLVHDDLPAMDDDDMRRGRPTLHKATNEAMAILAGDAMLNFAFQIIVERVGESALAARLMHELAIGTTGMIAGQVYDTLGGFADGLDDQQRLVTVHRNKTGALLRASCRMGALCAIGPAAGDGDARLDALTGYGDAIGLMFQVVDDILDVTQTAAHTGKRTGKDKDAGKLTYPGVIGLERSRQIVRDLHAKADAVLAPLGKAADPLRAIAAYMAVRTK